MKKLTAKKNTSGSLDTHVEIAHEALCTPVTSVAPESTHEEPYESTHEEPYVIVKAEHSAEFAAVLSNTMRAMSHMSSTQIVTLVVPESSKMYERESGDGDQPAKGMPTRQGTVRFGNIEKTASSSTRGDDSSTRRSRSEGSLLQRLFSRSRSRTMMPRTKSRLATLLVMPEKGRSRRARVTLDALPKTAHGENTENAEKLDDVNDFPVKLEKVTRSNSCKNDRRGRSLFRGIGAHFSTSANRRRACSPVRDREGAPSLMRWRRRVSLSPEPRPRTWRTNRRAAGRGQAADT